MSYFKRLENRKILSVHNNDNGFTINFEDGSQKFIVEADCCSESWIEHVTVPDDIAGATLLSISDGGGVEVQHPDHECLQVYETRFHTNKGDIVLEYRNSSNGYYGGTLMMVNDGGNSISRW